MKIPVERFAAQTCLPQLSCMWTSCLSGSKTLCDKSINMDGTDHQSTHRFEGYYSQIARGTVYVCFNDRFFVRNSTIRTVALQPSPDLRSSGLLSLEDLGPRREGDHHHAGQGGWPAQIHQNHCCWCTRQIEVFVQAALGAPTPRDHCQDESWIRVSVHSAAKPIWESFGHQWSHKVALHTATLRQRMPKARQIGRRRALWSLQQRRIDVRVGGRRLPASLLLAWLPSCVPVHVDVQLGGCLAGSTWLDNPRSFWWMPIACLLWFSVLSADLDGAAWCLCHVRSVSRHH